MHLAALGNCGVVTQLSVLLKGLMGITALGLTEEIGGLPIEAELIDLISERVVMVLEILGEFAVNEPLVSKVVEVNPMPPIKEL